MQPDTSEGGQSQKLLSKIKPKFLRRGVMTPFLNVNDRNHPRWKVVKLDRLAIISELRVRRPYLRRLHVHRTDTGHPILTGKFFLKISKQTMKYMTHIHTPVDINKNISNRLNSILKHSRCLKSVHFAQNKLCDIYYICQLIKYAGKHIQEISFNKINAQVVPQEVRRFYRSLSFFPKLKTIIMDIQFDLKRMAAFPIREDYFDLERHSIQKYLERLPCLKELRVDNWHSSKALGKFLREKGSQQCPLVTSLLIQLRQRMLPTGVDVTEITKGEVIKGSELELVAATDIVSLPSKICQQYVCDLFKLIQEGDAAVDDGENVNMNSLQEGIELREKLVQSFDFSIFPNLVSLNLNFSVFFRQEAAIVVGGFATLKNLEKMTLDFDYRPNGTYFIFEEILSLPSLAHFSIRIPFIRGQEWHLLTQFLQKQHNLTSLHLEITQSNISNRPLYRELILGLGNVLKALENTPKLEHLDLLFLDCPFNKFAQQRISQSLAQASLTVKQLKSFSFSGSFLPVGFENSSWDHLEGFRKFLHQQKSTLTFLNLSLDSLIDAGAAIYLSKILPDLSQLKTFKFESTAFGEKLEVVDATEKFFSEVCEMKIQEIRKLQNRTWNPLAHNFVQTLPRVPKLAELSLVLKNSGKILGKVLTDVPDGNDKSCQQEIYLTILDMLPELKALRNLCFSMPGELLEIKGKDVLLSLKHVNSIEIISFGQAILFKKAYLEIEAENARKSRKTEFQD